MKNLLYLATDDGLAIGRRTGLGWEPVERSLEGYQLTSVIAREGVILVGGTRGVLRSEDGGREWQLSSTGLGQRHIRWLAFHPEVSDLEFAGTEPASIFVSQDGAKTWYEQAEVATLREKYGWFLPYSPESGCVRGFAFAGQTIYAAVEVGGMLVSTDWGESWRLVDGSDGRPWDGSPSQGFIHPDVHMVTLHPDRPETIHAATGGGLYVSDDAGMSWRHQQRCYCRAVWIDPHDPRHLVAGPAESVDRNGWIQESLDGGRHWHPIGHGIKTPWPHHMVERFTQVGDWLLAVLSNGQLLVSAVEEWLWEPILLDVPAVRCVAQMV